MASQLHHSNVPRTTLLVAGFHFVVLVIIGVWNIKDLSENSTTSIAILKIALWISASMIAILSAAIAIIWSKYRVARDSTLKAEKESETTKLKLVHAARLSAVGKMAGSIAHEISSPLTVIAMQTQHLQTCNHEDPNALREEIALASERINRTVNRITKIVKSLRKLSHSGSAIQNETISVISLLNEILDISSEKIRKHTITLQCDINKSHWISGSSIELSQVFINLINNSVDAIMEETEKWILIESKRIQTPEGHRILITLTDSGKGIPVNIRSQIMTPFFTTKLPEQGTGLGLSISSDIIKAHMGRLYLDESSSRTCFAVELPEAECVKQEREITNG